MGLIKTKTLIFGVSLLTIASSGEISACKYKIHFRFDFLITTGMNGLTLKHHINSLEPCFNLITVTNTHLTLPPC